MGPERDIPIYIVSKGRHDSRLTHRTLSAMGVPHYVVVERSEYDLYASVIDRACLLVLDQSYKDAYDTFDRLGDSKSKGPGAARNFAWDHAISRGARWHWVMDDNIRYFFRLNMNMKIPVSDGTILRCMEDFSDQYENVLMAGPNYFMFASRKSKMPPVVFNTRIYSCNLIRCDAPFRWRGRYNEDTDLSLRILKAGFCTVQFNAFLQGKTTTQTLGGGNTKEFYAHEGTLAKSRMQVAMHPDVSKLVWKFGRWHHHVDYRPFKGNKLVRRGDAAALKDYGMRLITVDENDPIRQALLGTKV